MLGPLLDGFLFLVESLEGVKINNIDVEVELLGFFLMLGIGDEADSKLGSGDVRKSDGTGKSLILLGIVVLETDLHFDGFHELSLLSVLEDGGDGFCDLSLGELAHDIFQIY